MENITIKPPTPTRKRILITHAVGKHHEELVKSDACKQRAFVATGIWLPVLHLVHDENGVNNGPETVPKESHEKLQHLNEYKYTDQCPQENAFIVIDEQKRKEEEEWAENERHEAMQEAVLEAEIVAMVQPAIIQPASWTRFPPSNPMTCQRQKFGAPGTHTGFIVGSWGNPGFAIPTPASPGPAVWSLCTTRVGYYLFSYLLSFIFICFPPFR